LALSKGNKRTLVDGSFILNTVFVAQTSTLSMQQRELTQSIDVLSLKLVWCLRVTAMLAPPHNRIASVDQFSRKRAREKSSRHCGVAPGLLPFGKFPHANGHEMLWMRPGTDAS
jgi:hypothetical protein